MIHIKELKEGLPIFKALSSDVRIEILQLLTDHGELNMNEIATKLNLTSGAITAHIKKLNECGLIKINTTSGKQGVQKICYLPKDRLLIDIGHEKVENTYELELNVGHYSSYQAYPTCGLATKDTLIGEVDDPRYFADPKRIHSEILWFTKGYIEYLIPNYLQPDQSFKEIQLSMELSSEAPGFCNDWPSNIYFYLNDIELGYWLSPGDFGSTKGIFTPHWWFPNWNQHGLLKLLSINNYGTFIDGLQISDVTLEDIQLNYKSDLKLKFAVPDDSKYVGGLTIYGTHFGNYNQGIHVRVIYDQHAPKE